MEGPKGKGRANVCMHGHSIKISEWKHEAVREGGAKRLADWTGERSSPLPLSPSLPLFL